MSDVTTRGVRVQVESDYDEERSDPRGNLFVFRYRVQITNLGEIAVQLRNRRWMITAADGRTERVKGPGVVGEQPTLAPGASFRYRSFCPLPTPMGTMHGHYEMCDADGEWFEAEIGTFMLTAPQAVN